MPSMPSRPSHKVLWAATLAVLIQFGAPIWVMAMLSAQATNAFAAAPICSEHPAPDDRTAPPLQHGSVCPICQFAGQASQFVMATAPIAIAPAEIGCVARIRHAIAEPRAPPPRYAQARAPPASL